MQLFRADATGNTFLVLVTREGLYQPLSYLEKLRQAKRWDFDSALVLNELGTGIEVNIVEKDATRSVCCGNGLRAVAKVLDLLGRERRVLVGTELISIRRMSEGVYRVPMGKVAKCGTFQKEGFGHPLPIYYIQGELHVVSVTLAIELGKLEELGKQVVPNANFTMVAFRNANVISALTYERGARRITQSSGTGACAAVQACRDLGLPLNGAVKVRMLCDESLIVSGDHTGLVLEGSVTVTEEFPDPFLGR